MALIRQSVPRGDARKEIRRTEMIERLIDVFLVDGFLSFSVDELVGRLRCSKSTLYTIAGSKEQIVITVIRAYFRRSATRVEARLEPVSDLRLRIYTYLHAIAEELSPASPRFFADLDFLGATREIYKQNTRMAARRVQQLVTDLGSGNGSGVDVRFIGAVAGQIMEAIHRGEIEAATSLDDSAAFRALADLIVSGTRSTADARAQ